MSCKENLALSLKLEVEGKSEEIFSGNIEAIWLSLNSYGHSGRIYFSDFGKEEIHELLNSPKVLKVTLVFKSLDPEQSEPLLEIKGIVNQKSFRRMPTPLGLYHQTIRHYEIFFIDNAKYIWEQKFPTRIYIDETMKDVIEKHNDPDISIKYDWDKLEDKRPIIAFSLSKRHHASFYSFLIWYLHQENGLWSYDYKTHSYSITGKKMEAEGEPLDIYEKLVAPPLCKFSQPPRFNIKKIKHSSDTVDYEEEENENSIKSVTVESMDALDYHAFPELAHEVIHSTQDFEKDEIDLEFVEFSDKVFIDKLIPGSFIRFKGEEEGSWCNEPCYKDKIFRIRNVYIEANKEESSEELVKSVQAYKLTVKAKLELPEETFAEWPIFIPPTYPFAIHGKIFSDLGDKEQTTYKILETPTAPLGQYLVHVPLAGEEKKVVAPFTPDFMTGQCYFPLCKEEKVMLSMYFGTAKIQRTIDWQPFNRLPLGVQANQMILGSNGKDKYVILRHEFEDGKDSIFTIKQSSSETQTQTIQIKEDEVLVTVEEKDKKNLSIRLNKEEGVVVSFEDQAAGVTQQTSLDGKAMTHTCKGSDGTSIIVQKPDSVAFECKNFTVNSDTVVIEAKDSISFKGTNKVNIEAKVANVDAASVKLGG